MIKANQKLSFPVSLVPRFLADGALRRSLERAGGLRRPTRDVSEWVASWEMRLGWGSHAREESVEWWSESENGKSGRANQKRQSFLL